MSTKSLLSFGENYALQLAYIKSMNRYANIKISVKLRLKFFVLLGYGFRKRNKSGFN